MISQDKSNGNRKNVQSMKLSPEEKALLRMEALHSNINLEIKHSPSQNRSEDECDLDPSNYIETEMGYGMM